jgi:predicted alpha/beta hydrolase family esterase
MTPTILLLPGLHNSGDGHWQTIWEHMLPNARRVQQDDWDAPRRTDWVARLDAALAAASGPVLLVAHSLGCALIAWWAATGNVAAHGHKVNGALLVAPPDVERENFPAFVADFAPMPRTALPFGAIVAASSNDPWCGLEKARGWADAWGAQFHEVGAHGHINADSGLGDWPQARGWIEALATGRHN